jgi:peptidoglycan/LPS O-acetylase OafA/YrhL
MQDLLDRLAALIGHQPTLLFSALLVPHVFAGMTCVATGAIAALSPKRPGRHPTLGSVYFWALAVVFVTSSGMSILRWSEDAYLFVLGTLAFGCALFGLTARRQRWPGWTTAHILAMSGSYIVLLTAFYVDNGPRLPLWKELPPVAFWIGPALIGTPIVARALARHTHVGRDLGELRRLRRHPLARPTDAR